ncbi:MAG TPA: CoA transferase [Gemmatimonadaceae bacterium]|jgi:crotonobetainyl-CoA:carnitine CoA-transferase CaiB-like acyl-CoA transferase
MLAGFNVLDLSRVLAGPLASMLLGDLGANVIKVERPGSGDDTRSWGPPFDSTGASAYYLSVNRNKKSIVADLADANDRALIRNLMASSDVVIDNFKRGMLERNGIDVPMILAAQPSLVWCTITGFGANSDRPGYDFVVQAEQGWMSITGEQDGAPMKVGVALADIVAGKDACIAILAALVARSRTGRGRHVTVSLAASASAALVNVAQNALVSGKEPQRWGNGHPNLVPYQLFEASDRALVIAVGNDAQWLACAKALGLDALVSDVGLRTNAGRVAERDRVMREMSSRIAERPASHWISRLDAVGVPCGVVRMVLESLRDIECSATTGIAPSVPGTVRFPPPRLDEHGLEIRELGWASFKTEH